MGALLVGRVRNTFTAASGNTTVAYGGHVFKRAVGMVRL